MGFLLLWRDTMTKTTLIRTIFNWDWLTGSEVLSIIIKVGAWQLPGRLCVWRSECSTSCSKGKQENSGFQKAKMRVLNTTSSMTPFLQQGHTYSNKATPIPTGPNLLIVPLPTSIIFKPSQTPTQNTYRYTHSHKMTWIQIETYIQIHKHRYRHWYTKKHTILIDTNKKHTDTHT